jgi:hypothetical protein
MAITEIDADTGDEILYFARRFRPYLYLRDTTTKQFIRRLRHVEIRLFMVVDYSESEAKKGNPLYVDTGIFTQLTPEEFTRREDIETQLETMLKDEVKGLFGEHIVQKLLELAGVEYGSQPKYTSRYEESKAHYVIVWKHKKEQPTKKVEGEAEL